MTEETKYIDQNPLGKNNFEVQRPYGYLGGITECISTLYFMPQSLAS